MKGYRFIKYSISLAYIKNDFQKSRNMLVHHGLMGSSKNFKSISKNGAIANYVNSYLIDCRNHGQSPHTATHTIEDLADDLYDFIHEHKLTEGNNLTLMGHSMGGLALMKFTQKYPDMQSAINRVIIIDVFCSASKLTIKRDNTGKMLENMATINLNQSTEQIFKQIDQKATGKDVAGLIKMNVKVEGQNKHSWIPNLSLLASQYDHILNFQLTQNKWRKPVQLIYGAKSNLINDQQIEQYCRLYPQMSKTENFYRIRQAGHWVHFENTKEFLSTTEHILKKGEF